jgi:hypothetical protein
LNSQPRVSRLLIDPAKPRSTARYSLSCFRVLPAALAGLPFFNEMIERDLSSASFAPPGECFQIRFAPFSRPAHPMDKYPRDRIRRNEDEEY